MKLWVGFALFIVFKVHASIDASVDLRDERTPAEMALARECVHLKRPLPFHIERPCAVALSKRRLISTREIYAAFVAKEPNLISPKKAFERDIQLFTQDPTWFCREPARFNYFKLMIGIDPFPNRPCTPDLKVFPLPFQKETDLNPNRVYGIDLLLADRGSEAASRFGHFMFRVIRCDPARETLGPECRGDIAHHLVVSFRANPYEPEIKPLKGILGEYPSQLFLHSLTSIRREYNQLDFRSLKSIPLRLSRKEIEQFSYRVWEFYWNYQGKYAFFSHNCATESLDLLKTVIENDHLFGIVSITPFGIYEQLKKLGLTQDPNTELLPLQKTHFEKAFQFLKDSLGESLPYATLDQYLHHSTALERKQFLTVHTASNLAVLEMQISRLLIVEIRKNLFRHAYNHHREWIQNSFPGNWPNKTPPPEELWIDLMAKLFPEQLKEIENTQNNYFEFSKLSQTLNRATPKALFELFEINEE